MPELAEDDILRQVGEVAGAEIAIFVAGGRDVVVQVIRPHGHRRLREPGRHQIAQCHQFGNQSPSMTPTIKPQKSKKKIKKKKLPNQEDGERRLRVQAKTGKGGLIDEAAEPAAQGDAQAEG